jgi:hypothetical protein
MAKKHVICPWCQTESFLEEDERFCPYCGNELTEFRSVSFDFDFPNEEDDEEDAAFFDADDFDDGDQAEEGHAHRHYHTHPEADDDYYTLTKEELILQRALEQRINEQSEAPECPSCREYMLETGRTTVTASAQADLLTAPYTIIRYVCPACYAVLDKLAEDNAKQLFDRVVQDHEKPN